MPIKVQCACGKSFAAKDELAGKTVKCPNCQQPLKIAGAPVAAVKSPGKPGAGQPAASSAGGKPAAATKPATVKPAAAKPAAARPAPAAPAGDSLFDEIGLQKVDAGTRPCPGCMEPLAIEAVICVKCGYNTRIGRRMQTVKVGMDSGAVGHSVVAQDLLERAAQTMEEDVKEDIKKTSEGAPWWVWLIALCLLIGFGCMMLLLPLKMAMFGAAIIMYSVAALVAIYSGIRLIIVAFTESMVQGLLYLFVPFYALFYIITRWDRCGAFFLMNLGAGAIGGVAMGIGMIAASMENAPAEHSLHRPRGAITAQVARM